ncbi:MAG: hypothetical protein IJR77_07530 [Bacteroidales bacterium]|nr:hypothetical protein [Bacteroidales bacterium]
MKRLAGILAVLWAIVPVFAGAKSVRTSVAIVVDEQTGGAVSGAIDNYASAIRSGGKDVFVISVPAEADPCSIRDTLKFLHENRRLEGAVLVGDIPVPMIRRAHHLATAFKMNPAIRRDKSSIPSDRFYDDFSLEFIPLGSEGPLWYYDLSPKGAQRVVCDIYTARIKPSKTDPEHSYTSLIAEFLDRAAARHSSHEAIDRVFHFGGHGNSSESFNARIDENRAYYEMFSLSDGSGRVDYINFDEDQFVRDRLQKILSMKELDIVHLHTHGAVGAQYISKEPYTFMTAGHVENVKSFLRGKMRSAKDKDKTRADLMAYYDVPESWLAGWDDPEQISRDSIRSASVDIVLEDLDGFVSGPSLIMLDACFNGAFLHDDYVAARYAFSHGSNTIAVTANSVNIIQDHWKNELIGLLSQGVCIGNWIKNIQTLESHLFGDPTYVFASRGGNYDAEVAFPTGKSARKMLSSKDPSVCGFGIKYLFQNKLMQSSELLSYMKNDPRMNVRMEALMSMVRNPADYGALVATLSEGLGDSYELVRRMSARYASICCDPALEEVQQKALDNPLVTSRVRSHLVGGLYGVHNEKDALEIADKTLSAKDRGFAVSAQRNKCNPAAVDPMLELLADSTADKALRIKAAEALGWYVLSVRRDDIYKGCKKLVESESDPEIKDELTRTIARLEDLAYCR